MQSNQKNNNMPVKGLVPPNAFDLEKSIIGAMINFASAVDEVLMLIRHENVFYNEVHQVIFKAIKTIHESGEKVDLLTVSHQLKVMGKLEHVGGDYALINLSSVVTSSAHVEYWSRIVLQYFLKRKIIMFNAGITALAYSEDTDVFDLLDRWQKEFDGVVDLTSKGRSTMSLGDSLIELKENIKVISSNTDEVTLVGQTTGFKRTDLHTGGYRNQNLVIIAARPGMGKTAKVLKTVVENVKKGDPVGMFSLEMSMQELTARIVAIDTDFHLGQLLKKGFDKPKYFQSYDAHADRIKDYKLIVDDSGNSDITDLVITAKMWKRVHGIKMLVVDYIQLMKDKSIKGNREAEVASISRRLKMLAKELDIPVIALSQLSRAVETRGGSKRPMLSDLRDSGAIEQDADIIEFIYRPEYYGCEMLEDDYEEQVHKESIRLGANTEIIIAKYRGGSLGTPLLRWVGDKTKFVDVGDVNDTVNYIDDYSFPIPKGDINTAFDA